MEWFIVPHNGKNTQRRIELAYESHAYGWTGGLCYWYGKQVLGLINIDTFVMGDDWKGKFDFLREKCEVVYLERMPEISTTQIKKDLSKI